MITTLCSILIVTILAVAKQRFNTVKYSLFLIFMPGKSAIRPSGLFFATQDAITLGGFLTEQLQHLPKKGERVIYKSFCFLRAKKATRKRVTQVLIFEEVAEG